VTEILGYILAVFVGFSLGLLGGGGSILTVPILVYVLGIEPVLATTYSLFIVGSTATIGAYKKIRSKLVDFRAALFFGLPSLLGVLATRRYVLPTIPDTIISTNWFTLSKSNGIMLLFAVLMLLAAYRMIKGSSSDKQQKEQTKNIAGLMLYGIFVGFITALVGAGGGFLIVPAMVLLLNLPIKKAVATSLLIITANSLIGFLGDMSIGLSVNWSFMISFALLSITGVFVGVYTTRFVEPMRLKKIFGWFVLTMALAILSSEIYLKL
jgi:uncharacterized membrane protein YfcA